jgi:hypothetical protein
LARLWSITVSGLGACLLIGSATAYANELWAQDQPDTFGQDLFEGRVGAQAKMSGHSMALPVQASRCINCHESTRASRQTQNFGTQLNRRILMATIARRGGPASRYDALSFCKVIREGLDPANVVINSAMPRYQVSDAQCTSLWSYVMSRS